MKKKLLRPIAICLGFFVGRKELSLFEFVKEWRLGLRRVRDFFWGRGIISKWVLTGGVGQCIIEIMLN